MRYSKKDFEEHLRKEHHQSPFSTYLKEIVYGGIDGIITTFAVVAGFAGAEAGDPTTLSVFTLLLFGFANLFADGISMGVGNFLSVRADQDVYKAAWEKEKYEIENEPEMETQETKYILMQKGFSRQDAEQLTKIYKKNKKYWLEFMMKDELEMPDPTGENPFLTALATTTSFLFFGFIPLIPYLIYQKTIGMFQVSILFTAGALFSLGFLRWIITKRNLVISILEVLILGGIAAGIAYYVGVFWQDKL